MSCQSSRGRTGWRRRTPSAQLWWRQAATAAAMARCHGCDLSTTACTADGGRTESGRTAAHAGQFVLGGSDGSFAFAGARLRGLGDDHARDLLFQALIPVNSVAVDGPVEGRQPAGRDLRRWWRSRVKPGMTNRPALQLREPRLVIPASSRDLVGRRAEPCEYGLLRWLGALVPSSRRRPGSRRPQGRTV